MEPQVVLQHFEIYSVVFSMDFIEFSMFSNMATSI
jgi:hypothetical protein